MTGTRVNSERQTYTVLYADQQKSEATRVLALAPPPPPQVGEAVVSSPSFARYAQQPNGQRGVPGCHVSH